MDVILLCYTPSGDTFYLHFFCMGYISLHIPSLVCVFGMGFGYRVGSGQDGTTAFVGVTKGQCEKGKGIGLDCIYYRTCIAVDGCIHVTRWALSMF